MDTSNMITGQIIFRDTGDPGLNGRKKMFLVGIVDIPADVPIKGEHQYTVFSPASELSYITLEAMNLKPLLIALGTETDVSDRILAHSADGILRSPLWRT